MRTDALGLAAALLLTVACVTALNADAHENAVDAKAAKAGDKVIEIGSNRELFVDEYLIDNLDGARMVLHQPRNEGPVMKFDKPWEGGFCGHFSVIKDGDLYRMFYRGAAGDDPEEDVVCMAESKDGKAWTKPKLGLFEVHGTRENNVVHANDPGNSKNLTAYAVFLDTRPGVPKDERYKATATAGIGKESNGRSIYELDGSSTTIRSSDGAKRPDRRGRSDPTRRRRRQVSGSSMA